MKLINEWRKCWKFFSVQANALGGAITVGYVSLYDKLKDNFPAKYMVAITAAVFILGIIGRLVSQQPKDKP
jgi:phosphoribosylformylglycinamidine (FGAM) synthase-like enzyme